MKKNTKTALITGGSSGIGYELSKIFLRENYDVVLVASNKEKLIQAAKKLLISEDNIIKIIPADLANPKSARAIFEQLKKEQIQIDVLVNNAGFGSCGKFVEMDLLTEESMVNVNVNSLMILTKLFAQEMVKRGSGKILNVASVAGFLPGPLMAVYYASKAFVVSFSQALSSELEGTGVTVSVLCPGPTATEFQKRAFLEDSSSLGVVMMNAKEVSEIGFRGLMTEKRIIVPGLRNKLQVFLIRFIPTNILLSIIRKINE